MKSENDLPEVLVILGDPSDGRIGTQFAGDEIDVNLGIRTAGATRRIVKAVNSHDVLMVALRTALAEHQHGDARLTESTYDAFLKLITAESEGANDPECRRCGSLLDGEGYCTDQTCPFDSYLQNDSRGMIGHPDCEGV